MRKEILVVIGCFCIVLYLLGCKENKSSESGNLRQILSSNFDENEVEIYALVNYFESIVPGKFEVSFGFGNSKNSFTIGILEIDPLSRYKIFPNQGGRNIPIESQEMTEKLAILHWTIGDLDTLKSMLENVNCTSISSGDPICLVYGHGGINGLASMFYLLFKEPVSDSLRKQYERMEGYSIYRDNIVFQAGYPL